MLKPIKHIGSDFEVNGNGLPYGASILVDCFLIKLEFGVLKTQVEDPHVVKGFGITPGSQ